MNAPTNFIADYNPDALATIRAMASTHSASDIADVLGWDVETLQRRAANHHIELRSRVAANTLQEMIESLQLTPSKASQVALRPKSERAQLLDFAATLPSYQALIFGVLARRIAGDFITCDQIVGKIDLVRAIEGVSKTARHIGRKLDKTPWRIESKMGRGGGFRLVRVASS